VFLVLGHAEVECLYINTVCVYLKTVHGKGDIVQNTAEPLYNSVGDYKWHHIKNN